MFGYIRPAAPRLTERETGLFRAAYCGLCHTLARRYGFLARFLLNFDFTFLAILLSGGEEPACAQKRCIARPCRGCRVMTGTAALDAAADRSVILTWWQIRDGIADHGFFSGLRYRLAALLLRGAYRKARRADPAFDEQVSRHLADLARVEREKTASLDAAADPFASLMADMAECEPDDTRRRILRQLFYHLGRWIYLIDAADDLADDARSGNYNPLRFRYGTEGETLTDEQKSALAQTLDDSVRRMAGAYALCDYGVWTPILDSIFYESFYAIGKAVLDGTYHRLRRGDATRLARIQEEDRL